MKTTIYTCNRCRKQIVGDTFLDHNEPQEGHVYTRELLTLTRCFIVAVAVNDSTQYEWHFCSKECMNEWSER